MGTLEDLSHTKLQLQIVSERGKMANSLYNSGTMHKPIQVSGLDQIVCRFTFYGSSTKIDTDSFTMSNGI